MAGHHARFPPPKRHCERHQSKNSGWKNTDEESPELFTLFAGHPLGGGRDGGRRLRLTLSPSMELALLNSFPG